MYIYNYSAFFHPELFKIFRKSCWAVTFIENQAVTFA